MATTGLGSRARHVGTDRQLLGDGQEAAEAARLGSYPGAGADRDYAAEYDPSYGRDTDRWVMDEWGDPEPSMPAGWPNVELRPWVDCMIEALDEVLKIRRSKERAGFHEFSEYSQDDYDRALDRLESLAKERRDGI